MNLFKWLRKKKDTSKTVTVKMTRLQGHTHLGHDLNDATFARKVRNRRRNKAARISRRKNRP